MPGYEIDVLNEIEKAENGDLDAMFNVASYIVWGDRDSTLEPELAERAIRYYQANIEAGDTDSMLDLGAMYLNGRGVVKDEERALDLYELASYENAPKAFRCLGNYWKYDQLEDGSPVATTDGERLQKAYAYFEKGADLEEENSLYELGDFYRYGICVKKNERKAFCLYMEAYKVIMNQVNPAFWNDCYSDVCLRLAECYHYGIGVRKNMQEAGKFIQIAKTECKRRLEEGDMYGGVYLRQAEKEWQLIMQEKENVI